MSDNLSKELVDLFLKQIKTGILKPGDKIDSQRDIAIKYNMGRSTAREAIQALVLFDIFKSIPGKGIYVSELSLEHAINPIRLNLNLNKKSFSDFYELRILLETWAVKEVINKITEKDISLLEKIINDMEFFIENDGEAYILEDFKFHNKIFELSENDLIISIYHFIKEQLEYWISVSFLKGKPKNVGLKEHMGILNGIKSKDYKKANIFILKHLEASRENILQHYK